MSKYLSKVKMSLFTLILTFMLIGMIAVKGVTKKVQVPAVEPEIEIWYFIGDLKSDPLDPANYSAEEKDVRPCTGGEEVICQIQVPNTQNAPLDFNAPSLKPGRNIKQQILEVLEYFDINETLLSYRQE